MYYLPNAFARVEMEYFTDIIVIYVILYKKECILHTLLCVALYRLA